jgi:hypothetical protein
VGKPPVHLTVEGDGLKALQRKMKALEGGGKVLRRELNKALRDGAKPLIDDARSAARSRLPHAGGLNDRIASAPMRIAVSASQREPGVKVVVKGVDARSTNSGRLRHPVFNRADRPPVWVTQRIDPGWFTDAMREKAPRVRPHLLAAMERAAQEIVDA